MKDFLEKAKGKSSWIGYEFWRWLVESRKWWLVPVMVTLLLLCLFVILGSGPAAVFIYPLF